MGVSTVYHTSASPEQSEWTTPSSALSQAAPEQETTAGKGLLRGLAPLPAFPHFSEHRESGKRGGDSETGTQKTRDKDSEAPGCQVDKESDRLSEARAPEPHGARGP